MPVSWVHNTSRPRLAPRTDPRLLDLLLQILDRFVPDSRRQDPVELRQSYLIVSLLLIIIVTLPVNIFQQVLTERWWLLSFSLTTVAVYTSALLTYKRRALHSLTAQVLLVWGFVGILGTSAMSGGIYSPVMPFLALLPLLALALRDRRSAVLWIVNSGIGIAGMAVAAMFQLDMRADAAVFETPIPVAVNLLLMLAYAAGFAWFLESLNTLHRDQLVEKRIQADDANAAKSEFLANMSHELRTPMNGVLGLTEIVLMDEQLAPQHRARLHTVLQSGRALVDLLNHILDLSKVEAGQLVLEDIPWSPHRVMRDVECLFGEVARRKGLDLSLHTSPEGLPDWVRGDPTRVRQVLCNLVGNAVKFTEHGTVRISLEAQADHIVVSVKDSGPGISTTVQARIFEPFSQADASTARRHGGTGLGLTICRRLTTMMGGDIELDSIIGGGSTFRFRLPIHRCPPPSNREEQSNSRIAQPPQTGFESQAAQSTFLLADGLRRRVLLVEDVEVNRMVATTMLEQLGFSVDSAEDGARGLATILGDPTYDLVLMDWHLPEMDGLEVTRLVRLAGHKLPIVGLSASVRPEERIQAMQAGMDDFLGKPFSRQALEATLSRMFEPTPTGDLTSGETERRQD